MMSAMQAFSLIGALALFIYGMVVMSEAIQRLTGSRLRRAVAAVTRNPSRAYFSGLGLTALIQSSSVTSVMCVSLTQVGLLRLSEAYFVLLGANLGTTVTGWLVALTVDKPSIGGLALPMLAAALPFLFARRRRFKSFAEAVIGFCLMFIGLGLLREGIPPITEAGLAGFLSEFDDGRMMGALGIVAIGILGTVAFQSSSAMLALVFTLAAGGVVTEWVGAAVVLGANIGTTSTVILASVVAGREARRAALSHTLVNLLGVLLILPVLHVVLDAIHWFFDPVTEGGLAVALVLATLHTGFNGFLGLLFGFVPKPILWCVRNILPGESLKGYRAPMVTASGMDVPELQVLEAQREAERHHEVALKMLRELRDMLGELNADKREAIADRIKEYRNLGARYEAELKSFLERLARNKLSGATYRQVQFLLEWTTDMAHVVELAYRFRQLQMEREEGEVYFVPKQRKRLLQMLDGLIDAMSELGKLNGSGPDVLQSADLFLGRLESSLIEVDGIREQMRSKHREDIRKGRFTVESGMAFSEMGDLLEEVGLRIGLLSTKFNETVRA